MTDNPTPGLSIDFAAIAGAESSAPAGAAEATLGRSDSGRALEEFSCRSDLSPGQRAQLSQVARQLVDRFLHDRSALSHFGDDALDGLNATVSTFLRQQGNLRIPEVENITKAMAKTVGGFRKKYKRSDPRLLNALERFAESLTGVFQTGQRFLRQLYVDSQSAVERLDSVAGTLVEHKHTLDRNVLLCDELYASNDAAMTKVIGVIALMEEVLDELQKEVTAKKFELAGMSASQSPERRKADEELQVLLEMLEELEVRRSEFVSRLFVAWSTAPQIRNMRKVSNSLSQRLHLLVVLTIPTMKLTISQWGLLLQMEEAGTAAATTARANNDALQEYAAAMGGSLPKLALLTQTPTVMPETIMAIADSVVAQHEGMVRAVAEGRRLRAELDDTVVKAMRTINASGDRFQRELAALLQRRVQAQPLDLGAPEIPEAVIDYDRQR
ncbi:MAG: toxic anion resistance protein [Micropruina sp.]|uniref:toxic anion resistance protein n=1 Tax=Micropruina sp. TaxID=2737536 RepID=UPI0039E4C84E